MEQSFEKICAKLFLDCLRLNEEEYTMTNQEIIDILFHVKCFAAPLEYFPVNSFIDNGTNMDIVPFLEEWKKLFECDTFDGHTRAQLFMSLGGKIGTHARMHIKKIQEAMQEAMQESIQESMQESMQE